jgi:hypothetical protein
VSIPSFASLLCGHKGATIQHPGWGGADIGFLPFPTNATYVANGLRQLA